MNPSDYNYLLTLPGNRHCVDCGADKPDWGSPKLGILFCLDCSGRHRGLGTHLSFVRSVYMDQWTDDQIALMKVGGNQQCNDFLAKYGIDAKAQARDKYASPAAALYRQVLQARVDGKPEPTELPLVEPSTTPVRKKMQGFGSGPPPPQQPRANRLWMAVPAAAALAVVLWYYID